jgi:flagellar motor switch protein FliM
MEKVLNQEEIDAMVRAARSGGADSALPLQPGVELWDARRAGQIGREQLQAITALHEGFARNLTHALGAFLRVIFATTLVSAEHLAYREFLQRIPETTYVASCRLDPMGVNAGLQLDLKVAFPIIDLLLGGEGKGMAATRDTTDIEEQILDSVARIICRELGAAWQALSMVVNFEERLDTGAVGRLMGPEEKVLCLSFEVTMPDVRGGLNLAVPAAVSNALLRKISADWSHRRPRGITDSRPRLMRRLLHCPFQVELGATDVRVAVSALAALTPGLLLPFARSAAEPASLLVAGREMFRALPARCGKTRAARILERVSDSGAGSAETPDANSAGNPAGTQEKSK